MQRLKEVFSMFISKVLRQLHNKKDVLSKVVEKRRQQILSDQLHYRVFEDGQYFKNNVFCQGRN